MMKLTDELSQTKDRLAEMEADNEAKQQKIQEQQLEMQELEEQYEQNKHDLYE